MFAQCPHSLPCKPRHLSLSGRGATTDTSFATNTSGKELVLFLLGISVLLQYYPNSLQVGVPSGRFSDIQKHKKLSEVSSCLGLIPSCFHVPSKLKEVQFSEAMYFSRECEEIFASREILQSIFKRLFN